MNPLRIPSAVQDSALTRDASSWPRHKRKHRRRRFADAEPEVRPWWELSRWAVEPRGDR